MHQFEHGYAQSFTENIPAVQGETTGILAPGIALVRLQALDQDQLTGFIEHRRKDIVIGQVAAAMVRVIAQEHIPRAPVIIVQVLQPVTHRELGDKRQVWGAYCAGREAAKGVDDTAIAFIRLVDDGRRSGAAQMGGGLKADCFHAAANNISGNRIH